MSLTDDPDFRTNLSEDGKYHVTLVYLVNDDGYCGGGYHAMYFDLRAGVGGQAIDEMIEQAYEFLGSHMEDENYMQSDVENIKNLVECHSPEEQEATFSMRRDGMNYQEMNNALLQMRNDTNQERSGKENI